MNSARLPRIELNVERRANGRQHKECAFSGPLKTKNGFPNHQFRKVNRITQDPDLSAFWISESPISYGELHHEMS